MKCGLTPRQWTAVLVAVAFLSAATAAALAESTTQTFIDVPPGHENYEAVEWAARTGITSGWGDGTFRPDATLTEQQAMTFLKNYFAAVAAGESAVKVTRGDMVTLLHTMSNGRPPTLPPPTMTAGGTAHLSEVGIEWFYNNGVDSKTDEWWYQAWVEEHDEPQAAEFGLTCLQDGSMGVWVTDPDAFVHDDDYSTEGVTVEYRIDQQRLTRRNWWRGTDYRTVATWGQDGPETIEALSGSERFRIWAGADQYSNSLQAEFTYTSFDAVVQACQTNTPLP